MSRDALVVGLNHYQCLASLKAPVHDAEAIAQRLAQEGEFRVQRYPEVIRDGRACMGEGGLTLLELEAALVQLFKPNGANVPETALFYFSGHGLQKEAGISEGFLATSDANPDAGFYGLSLFWLRRLLQESPVRKRVVWLDCCHSGTFLDFIEADPGAKPGTSRFFMAASREYEPAYEAIAGRHSVFTAALIEGLDPSRIPEGAITNYALTDWVSNRLKSELQQPLFENSGSEIILTRGLSAELPVLLPVAALSVGVETLRASPNEYFLNEYLPSATQAGTDCLASETGDADTGDAETWGVQTSASGTGEAGTGEAGTGDAGTGEPGSSGLETTGHETSSHETSSHETTEAPASPSGTRCPFPGLRAFEPQDYAYFTGREALVQQVLSALQSHNLVSLVGAASSGKTSLLQAGVIPALARRSREGRDRWQVKIVRPVSNPLLDLAAAFVDTEASEWERGDQMRRNGQLIAADSRGLLRLVQAHCHHVPGTPYDPREPRLLLIVDQFEALWQHRESPEADRVRQHFIESLTTLLQEESALVHVVVAVRSDCWEDCYQRTELLQQGPSQLVTVEPLPEEALKAAILKPALRVGWQCEIHLADLLLEDVASSPARLALLQLALRSIWQRQTALGDDRVMRLATYADLGRIRGLLVAQAQTLLKQLSEGDQSFVQRIFLALTQLGEGAPDGLRRLSKSELGVGGDRGASGETLAAILETLIESRLVVSAGTRVTLPPQSAGSELESGFSIAALGKSPDWVEASHESLIRDWPDLRSWIEQHRDRLTRQRRIERYAQDWCEGSTLFEESGWLKGDRLKEAEAYLRDHPDELSSLAQHFIHLSQSEGSRPQSKRRLVQIGLVAALSAVLFALMYLAFYHRRPTQGLLPPATGPATRTETRSRSTPATPQELYQKIAQAHRVPPGDPMTSLLIGALDLTPSDSSSGFEAELAAQPAAPQPLPQLSIRGKFEGTRTIQGLVFSPNQTHVAGIDPEGHGYIWDVEPIVKVKSSGKSGDKPSQERPQLRRLPWPSGAEAQASPLVESLGQSQSATMRPARSHLSGLAEVALRRDRAAQNSAANPRSAIQGLSFSADGQWLAGYAAEQKTVTIWSVGSGRVRHQLAPLPTAVEHLLYSPTEAKTLATQAGRSVYLWEVDERPQVAAKLEHPAAVEHMQYSLDGHGLVTSAGDRRLRLWDVGSGQLRHEWSASTAIAKLIVGQRRVAALGKDGSVQVWEQDSGELVQRLKLPSIVAALPEYRPSELAFNTREDQLILVQGPQGWNWNLTSGQLQTRFKLFAPEDPETRATFEPADPLEASLLNQARPQPRRQQSPSMKVFSKPTLRFSPDGSHLLATREREVDGEIRLDAQLLNLHTGSLRTVLKNEGAAVVDARFSQDGSTLATTNQDGTLIFWDVSGSSGSGSKDVASRPPSESPHDSSQAAPPAAIAQPKTLTVAESIQEQHWTEARPSAAIALAAHQRQMAARRSPADLVARPRQTLRLQANGQGSLTFLLIDEAGQLERWDSDSGAATELSPLITPAIAAPSSARQPIPAPTPTPAPTPVRDDTAITAADSSPDQARLATATAGGQITLWQLDPKGDRPQAQVLKPVPAIPGMPGSQRLTHLQLGDTGDTLLALDSIHRLHVWDVASGELMIWPQHLQDIRLAQLSRNGRRLLTADGQGTITLWDRDSGRALQALGLPGLTAASLDAEGTMMAIALPEGTIKLIDSRTGAIQTTLKGHLSPVRGLAFSPEGDRLLSGSSQGDIRLWNLGSGETTRTLQAAPPPAAQTPAAQAPAAITQVAFDPEGRYLAAADSHGVVRFWASDRESFAQLARDRSSRQLALDRCLSLVYTAGCPEPTQPSSLPTPDQSKTIPSDKPATSPSASRFVQAAVAQASPNPLAYLETTLQRSVRGDRGDRLGPTQPMAALPRVRRLEPMPDPWGTLESSAEPLAN